MHQESHPSNSLPTAASDQNANMLPMVNDSIELARNSQVGQAVRRLNHMYPINFSISGAANGANAMRCIPTLTGISLRYAKG